MIVVLVGYMASGKSRLGKVLAKRLNYSFIDLDDFIEYHEKSTIKDLFKTNGEIYFRKQESLYLNEILNNKEDIVLALGGGTPCYGNNMDRILNAPLVKSIYLKASIITLIKRLEGEKDKRPIISHIKDKNELTEFIAKHLFERSPYYDLTQYKISTDGKSIEEIIQELLDVLI